MKKIMIIEDDTIISKELYELLVNAGYEALILKDFSNAKEEILKSNIDLILLDINIPYQNGEQLLKEIRKESNIPVIMVTSRANETDEILSGAWLFLIVGIILFVRKDNKSIVGGIFSIIMSILLGYFAYSIPTIVNVTIKVIIYQIILIYLAYTMSKFSESQKKTLSTSQ